MEVKATVQAQRDNPQVHENKPKLFKVVCNIVMVYPERVPNPTTIDQTTGEVRVKRQLGLGPELNRARNLRSGRFF